MNQDEKDRETLKRAQDLYKAADKSGYPGDWELAAVMFEKCGHYDDARVCREMAAACEVES